MLCDKALDTIVLGKALRDFSDADTVLDIVRNGVRSVLDTPLVTKSAPPSNSPSATKHINAVVGNLRTELDKGRCIAVRYSAVEHLWPQIHVSPIGVVEKSGEALADKGRIIHDLSWPKKTESNSVSGHTSKESVPSPQYHHVGSVVRRVLDLKRRLPNIPVHIMAGDVASAFRNVPLHEGSV